jgi:hypothetical protein
LKIKVAKWGTPKKYLKKTLNNGNNKIVPDLDPKFSFDVSKEKKINHQINSGFNKKM